MPAVQACASPLVIACATVTSAVVAKDSGGLPAWLNPTLNAILTIDDEGAMRAAHAAEAAYAAGNAGPLAGVILALFVITIAAAEVAVGIGLILLCYRRWNAADVDRYDSLSG